MINRVYRGNKMSFLDKLQQKLLNRSNSYKFYKNNYEKVRKEMDNMEKANKKQEEKIKELTIINDKNIIEIEKLKEINQTYVEENKYLKSLMDYEIKNIEAYLYELVELNNEKKVNNKEDK